MKEKGRDSMSLLYLWNIEKASKHFLAPRTITVLFLQISSILDPFRLVKGSQDIRFFVYTSQDSTCVSDQNFKLEIILATMFSQMSQDDTVRDMVRIESWKKCRLNTIFFIWNFYWAKIVLVLQKKVCLASHNNHPTSLASSWDISFLKSLVQQDPKGSNKVAHHFILDVYVSPNRKYVNLSIIYYITDFSFFMSQDDA